HFAIAVTETSGKTRTVARLFHGSARVPDRPAPARAGGPVLVDSPELDGALTAPLAQVVVVVLRTPGLRLEPLAAQAEPAGEFVQLLGSVRLQMPAAAPSSPVADRKGVVHVHAQPGQRRARLRDPAPLRLGHRRAIGGREPRSALLSAGELQSTEQSGA